MARRGRPAKGGAKRRRTTRAGRGYDQRIEPTEELVRHRIAATGSAELPDHDPLAVLYGRGLIDADEYQAGTVVRAAWQAVIGRPDARTASLEPRVSRDRGGTPLNQSAVNEAAEARAERQYLRLRQCLAESGRDSLDLVVRLAVYGQPDALVRDTLAAVPFSDWHLARLASLRAGLAAVARGGQRRASRAAAFSHVVR